MMLDVLAYQEKASQGEEMPESSSQARHHWCITPLPTFLLDKLKFQREAEGQSPRYCFSGFLAVSVHEDHSRFLWLSLGLSLAYP